MGDATKVNLAAWERDFKINVTSMVLMSRYAIPEMRQNGRGAIVNMSSVSGRESTTLTLNLRISNIKSSSRWKPQSFVSNNEGGHHPNDPCHGCTTRP
jgi:NAD(P)-dependent dehydrogenase (short-subunit alcohol dehydrogenase family)